LEVSAGGAGLGVGLGVGVASAVPSNRQTIMKLPIRANTTAD